MSVGKHSCPAFVVVKVRELVQRVLFLLSVFCFERAVPLCTWWSFWNYLVCVIWFDLPISRLCSWNESRNAALVQRCRSPLILAIKEMIWLHSLAKTTINLPKTTQNIVHHHHHHHQSLNREGRWGTTDDFATSFLHFPLYSTALWDLPKSRPVHSLMLSSHLFLCLPCLLPPFTLPCKMVLARPDERETWLYHCSLCLFTIVRSSCGTIACWILARTSSLVTWSLYETHSVLR